MSDTGVTTMADDAKAILGEGGTDAVAALEELAKDGIETRSMVLLSDDDEPVDAPVEVPAEEPVEAPVEEEPVSEEDELVQENVPVPVPTENAEFPIAEEKQEPMVEPVQVDEQVTLAKAKKKVVDKKKPKDKEAKKPDFPEEDEEDEAAKDKKAAAKKKKKPVKKADTEIVADSVVSVDAVVEVVTGPYGGATSFDGALDHQEAVRESWRLSDGWYVLQGVIDNIFNSPLVEDKHGALAIAMSQYVAFVKSDDTLWSSVIKSAVEEVVDTDNVGGVEDIDPAGGEAALATLQAAIAAGEVSQEDTIDDAVAVEPVEATPVVTDGVLDQAPIIDAAAVAPTSGAVSGNVAALSVVDDAPQVGAGYRRESSFSGVLQGLAEKGRQVARRSVPPAPVPVAPAQIAAAPAVAMSEATPATLETLVAQQVAAALAPVLDALSQFQGTAQAEPDVNAKETPRRPARKSQAPVAPARVTSQARTFGEALDGLLAQRR